MRLVLFWFLLLLKSSFIDGTTTTFKPYIKAHWNTTTHEHASQSSGYWPATALEATACNAACPISTTNSLSSYVHSVTVGAGNTLTFAPNDLDANIGDIVKFTFLALNHTLTQSSLELPCTNIGGFSTGFNQFNPKNLSGQFVVEYPVRTLDPQWFFCAQTKAKSHCRAGMVFALNSGGRMSHFLSAVSETFNGSNATTSEMTKTASISVLAATTSQPPSPLADPDLSTSTMPVSITLEHILNESYPHNFINFINFIPQQLGLHFNTGGISGSCKSCRQNEGSVKIYE
ncbi:putative GPI-anchored cupredoxin [Lachnellula willkommii]|uniref:Putative GPI-anchored cupredoxin n=1 Tax=Lachnellula willkommii TaxID=215461 RepID=A0A559MHA9_9HELO|nr:putative GPI-anchored cupredoxin [Lachnellula willkommii]